MSMETAIDAIRESISAIEAGRALGLEIDRHGRCACPVHNGTDRNCRLFDGSRGFYCFVCHASGDVFRLVQTVNGCTFPESVRWLDDTFGLHLLDRKPDRQTEQRARWQKTVREWEREQREATRAENMELALAAWENVRDLENVIADTRPADPNKPPDPRFAEAVLSLPLAREIAVETQMELIGSMEEKKR